MTADLVQNYFDKMCESMALEDTPAFPEVQAIKRILRAALSGGETQGEEVEAEKINATVDGRKFGTMGEFIAYADGRKAGWNAHLKAVGTMPIVLIPENASLIHRLILAAEEQDRLLEHEKYGGNYARERFRLEAYFIHLEAKRTLPYEVETQGAEVDVQITFRGDGSHEIITRNAEAQKRWEDLIRKLWNTRYQPREDVAAALEWFDKWMDLLDEQYFTDPDRVSIKEHRECLLMRQIIRNALKGV